MRARLGAGAPYIRQGECRGWMFGEGGLVFRKARVGTLLGAGIGRERPESSNRTLDLVPRKRPKSRPAAKSPARPRGNPAARPGWPRALPPRGPRPAPARPGGPRRALGGRFRPHPTACGRLAAAGRARGLLGRAPGPGWGGTKRSSGGQGEMEGGRWAEAGLRG